MYFEITKREILFSIVIVALMTLAGMVINDNISDHLMNKYQSYSTALRIENDKDMFQYGVDTNIGDTLAYGELKAVDTVTYEEIGGSYSYIEKAREEYRRHTRTVSNGKTTTTEVYYSWDEISRESKHSKKLSFLGLEFDYGKVKLPAFTKITTQNESRKVRYVYYGKKDSYTGTLYAKLGNGSIKSAEFYNKMGIEQTLEDVKSGNALIVFWICWVMLTIMIVFAFYYIDNKWLED